MSDDVAIKLDHVSKTFKLPHERAMSVKNVVVNFWRRDKGYEMQQVLKDISFEVKKGEFFGIVGRNGSGKSTLLKMMAGTYTPTSGSVQVNGSLTPFIELGVGFNPELTGRENVYLNGSLLGFDRKEMQTMYKDIVEFAELERFMDQKLKNYSSGMQVRLAFSIAIRARSDILLLDEVLAVGDEAFQRKCFTYFKELKNSGKTAVLVTHDMNSVREYCDRVILIEEGSIIESGAAQQVSQAYTKLFDPLSSASAPQYRWGDHRLQIRDISMKPVFESKKANGDIEADITILCNRPVAKKIVVSYAVTSEEGKDLFGAGLETDKFQKLAKGDSTKFKLTFPNVLGEGTYKIGLHLYVPSESTYCDAWIDAAKFHVKNGVSSKSHIVLPSKLEFLE